MMKIKYFLRLIILFLLILLPFDSANAVLNTVTAQNWASEKGEQILHILAQPTSAEKYASLDKILAQDVDLDHAARFAVGKYWKKMTAEQKDKYLQIFKNYTSALYQSYPLELEQGAVTYTIDKVVGDKDSQYVHCTIFINAVEKNVDSDSQGGVKVIFRLVKNDERIQVRDLQITETSFLLAYRERFYKMIHDDDDDMDWFLEDLEQTTHDMEEENRRKADEEM